MSGNFRHSNLLKDLKPYQWLFCIFGMNLPPFLLYRQEKDLKYYTGLFVYMLYSGVLLVGVIRATFIHIIIVKEAIAYYQLDSITELIAYVQNTFMALLQFLSAYKCWFSRAKFLDILNFIDHLEFNMLDICNKMFEEKNLKQHLLLHTGSCFLIIFCFLNYFNYSLIAHDMSLEDKLIFLFFFMSIQIKFLEYGIYMQLIFEYLLMLLKSLMCLKEQVDLVEHTRLPLDWEYLQTLKKNQRSLLNIWSLVDRLDKYFGLTILFLFFYNGIVIVCTVSWAYVQYMYTNSLTYQLFRLAQIGLLLMSILLLFHLAQKCINEYRKFSFLVVDFKIYPHDVEMIMAVKEYTLQLMHQPIQFNCNGFMDIDLSYYGKATLVIFSYCIILIQFKLTDLSEGAVRATKYIFGKT